MKREAEPSRGMDNAFVTEPKRIRTEVVMSFNQVCYCLDSAFSKSHAPSPKPKITAMPFEYEALAEGHIRVLKFPKNVISAENSSTLSLLLNKTVN